jgi:hypothetical protein
MSRCRDTPPRPAWPGNGRRRHTPCTARRSPPWPGAAPVQADAAFAAGGGVCLGAASPAPIALAEAAGLLALPALGLAGSCRLDPGQNRAADCREPDQRAPDRGASVCSRRSATRHRSDYRPWFLPGLIGISPAVQTLSTANAPTAPTRRSRSQRNLGVTRAMSSTAQRARRKTCWISPAGSRPRSDGGWLRRNRDQSSPEATSSDHWGRPAPTGPVVMRSIARPSPARTHTSL